MRESRSLLLRLLAQSSALIAFTFLLAACPGVPPPPAPQQGVTLDPQFNTNPYLRFAGQIPPFGDDFEDSTFLDSWYVRSTEGPIFLHQADGALIMEGTATAESPNLFGQVITRQSYAERDFQEEMRVIADTTAVQGTYNLSFFVFSGSGNLHVGLYCYQNLWGSPDGYGGYTTNAACGPMGPGENPPQQMVPPFLGTLLTVRFSYHAATRTFDVEIPELHFEMRDVSAGPGDAIQNISIELAAGASLPPGDSFGVRWYDFQSDLGGGTGYLASRTAFVMNGNSYSTLPEGDPGPVYVTSEGVQPIQTDGVMVPGLTGGEDVHAYLISAQLSEGFTFRATIFSPFSKEEVLARIPADIQINVDAEFPSVWRHHGYGNDYEFVLPSGGGEPPPVLTAVFVPTPYTNPGFLRPVSVDPGFVSDSFDDGNDWEDNWTPFPGLTISYPSSGGGSGFLLPGIAVQSGGVLYTQAVQGMSLLMPRNFALFAPSEFEARVRVKTLKLENGILWFGLTGSVGIECVSLQPGQISSLMFPGGVNTCLLTDSQFGGFLQLIYDPGKANRHPFTGREITLVLSLSGNTAHASIPEIGFDETLEPFSRGDGFIQPLLMGMISYAGLLPNMNPANIGPDGAIWDDFQTNIPLQTTQYQASVTPLALGDCTGSAGCRADGLMVYDQIFETLPMGFQFPESNVEMDPNLSNYLFDILGKFAGLRPGPAKAVAFIDFSQFDQEDADPNAVYAGGLLVNRDRSVLSGADGLTNYHAFLVRIPPDNRRATFYIAAPIPPGSPISDEDPILFVNPNPNDSTTESIDAIVINVLKAQGPGRPYKFQLPKSPQLSGIVIPPVVSLPLLLPPDLGGTGQPTQASFTPICTYQDMGARVNLPIDLSGNPGVDPRITELFAEILYPGFCVRTTQFASNRSDVAEVRTDAQGQTFLTARSAGEAVVTVSSGGLSADSNVRVVQIPPVSSGAISPSSDPNFLQVTGLNVDRFLAGGNVPQTLTITGKVRPAISFDLTDPVTACNSIHLSGNSTLSGGAAKANASIELSGSTQIIGDAVYGPTGFLKQTGKAGKITGQARRSGRMYDCDLPIRAMDVLADRTEQTANRGSIRLSDKQTITLPQGEHFFDSIELTGGSKIVAEAGTQIVVGDTLRMSGNSRIEGAGEWFVPSGTVTGPPPPTVPSGLAIAPGGTDPPYLKFTGSETISLTDEFSDLTSSDLWINPDPTASQHDGYAHCSPTGDQVCLYISANTWPGLTSGSILFGSADMIVDVLTDFPSHSSGIGLTHEAIGPESGPPPVLLFVRGDNQGNAYALLATTSSSGFGEVKMQELGRFVPGTGYHLELTYTHATRTFEGVIDPSDHDPVSFTIDNTAPFADTEKLRFFFGSSSGDVTRIDRVATNLPISLPPYAASKTPLQLDGVSYSDLMIFMGAPEGDGAIFLLPKPGEGPSPSNLFFVLQDDTRVDADGETDIHAALVTFVGGCDSESPPTTQRVTLYTTLDQATLQGITSPCISLDAFQPAVFDARGYGNNYAWTLPQPPPPSGSIDPPTEPSVSLTGNSIFSGVLIAPKATVSVTGSAQIAGALLSGHYVGSGSSKLAVSTRLLPKTILVPLAGSSSSPSPAGAGEGGGEGGPALVVLATATYRKVDYGPFGQGPPVPSPIASRAITRVTDVTAPFIPDPQGFVPFTIQLQFDGRDNGGQPIPTRDWIEAIGYDIDLKLKAMGRGEIQLAAQPVSGGLLIVDNKAPDLRVYSPLNDHLTNRRRSYSVGFTDDFQASAFVQHSIDGPPPSPSPSAIPAGAGLTIATNPFQPVLLSEGSNSFRVTARDRLGNESSQVVGVTLDTVPPVAILTSPSDDSETNVTSTDIQLDLFDPPGTRNEEPGTSVPATGLRLDSLSLLRAGALDGATVTISPSCTQSSALSPSGFPLSSHCSSLSNLAEGLNMIRAGIFDAAGNGGSDAVAVKLDTIQPIAKILTPQDACYNYRAVPHVFTFGDPEPGGRLTSIPMPDWFGPRMLEIELPAEGFIGPLSTGIDARTLLFTYDDSMISSAVRFTGSHGIWQIQHAEDLHHIALGINDHAGNAAPVQTHSYYVDLTPPENRIDRSPSGYDGFFLPQSNVSLDFSYRDPPPATNPAGRQSGLVLSTFGAGLTNLTPPPGVAIPPLAYNFMASDPGSFHVDLPYLPDGHYKVTSSVSDCATHATGAQNEFFIDTHPPILAEVSSPPQDQFLNIRKPVVVIACNDPYPSSGTYSLPLHVSRVTDDVGEPIPPEKQTFPTGNMACDNGASNLFTMPVPLDAGYYDLQAEMTDNARHHLGPGSIRRIGLDLTPPKFTLVSDGGLEIFESDSQFKLVVKVEEDFSGVVPGQQSSQFKAELINPLGQTTLLQPTLASGATSKFLNASFTVGSYGEGRHTVRFEVSDRAGNKADVPHLVFYVDFTPPLGLFAELIGPGGGTLVSMDGNATITFPPGSLASTTPVGISPSNDLPIGALGSSFEVAGLEGAILQKCVQVTINYDDQPPGRNGLNEQLIELQRFDESLGRWVSTPTTIEPLSNTATAQLCQFSEARIVEGNPQWHEEYAAGLEGAGLSSAPSGFVWKFPYLADSKPACQPKDQPDGNIQVVARGPNGKLWHGWRDGISINNWHSNGEVLPDQIASAPVGFTWTDGLIQALALTSNGKLWHAYRDCSGTWHSNGEVAGGFEVSAGGGVSGFVWTDGIPQALALSADPKTLLPFDSTGSGILIHAYRNILSEWSASTVGLPDILTSAPSGFVWSDGLINVVARGPTGRLWHGYRDQNYTWHSQCGYAQCEILDPLLSAPSGFMDPQGLVHALARGRNETLWDAWREGYSVWKTGGEVTKIGLSSAPSGFVWKGELHAVALDRSGRLIHFWRDNPVPNNGICETGESCDSFPQDCCPPPPPPPPPSCGNGSCESGESCSNCPSDCPCPLPEITSFTLTPSGTLAGNRIPFSSVCSPNGTGPTTITVTATLKNALSVNAFPTLPSSNVWDASSCGQGNAANQNPWTVQLCTKSVGTLLVAQGSVANPTFKLTAYSDARASKNPVSQSKQLGKTVFNPLPPDQAWGTSNTEKQFPKNVFYTLPASNDSEARQKFEAFWEKAPAPANPLDPPVTQGESANYFSAKSGKAVAIRPKDLLPPVADEFIDEFELKVQVEPVAPQPVLVAAPWLDPAKQLPQRSFGDNLKCKDGDRSDGDSYSPLTYQPAFIIPIYDESGQQRVPKLSFTFKNRNGSRASFDTPAFNVPANTY